MSDFTTVYFTCLDKGFDVSSVLCSFTIFGKTFTIEWYGAIIALGFTLAALLGGRIAWTWKISLVKMVDILIYGTFAGVIGARLYYVLQKWDYYGQHPGSIIKIWEGGLGIYGGIIAGIIAAYFMSKKEGIKFTDLLDMVCVSLLVGQGIGRWGNFTNQEAFGVNTDLPWGMWSEKTASYLSSPKNQEFFALHNITVDPLKPVHPTFLYESLWCLVGVAVLMIILRKARKFSGQVALCYGIWYGLERAVVEGLRTDSLYLFSSNIRTSQLLSVILVIACSLTLIILLKKQKLNAKNNITSTAFLSNDTPESQVD